MSLGQLKVMQEVITLAVFVPFALFYMKQPLKLDFLWAGLCLVAAAYFACSASNLASCSFAERRAQRIDIFFGRVPGTHEARFARAGRAPGIEAELAATARRCARRPAS